MGGSTCLPAGCYGTPAPVCASGCDPVACCTALNACCAEEVFGGTGSHSCNNDSAEFFVGARRANPDAAGTGAAFELELSNGLYDSL